MAPQQSVIISMRCARLIHHGKFINVIVAFGSSLLIWPSAVETKKMNRILVYRIVTARKIDFRRLQLFTEGNAAAVSSGPLGHRKAYTK